MNSEPIKTSDSSKQEEAEAVDDEEISTKNESSNEEEELPIEMQCEEVDMNDPKMDPLERTARRLIPIPKKYYWDTQNENLPTKTKVWHNTVYALGKATRFSESVGGVVANVLGLNQSRFEYVTSTMTEEEWETSRRISQERRKKREEMRKELEAQKARSQALDDVGVSHDAI